MRYIIYGLFIFGVLLFANSPVEAWSNGGFSSDPKRPLYGTHDWIADKALSFLPYEEKKYILDNKISFFTGTELPDNANLPDGIGDIKEHHIYYHSDGSLQDDASAKRAITVYQSALQELSSKNYKSAAQYAGILTHYIDDIAVFGHVMSSITDWGDEKHHQDYEDYVDGYTQNYNSSLFDKYILFDGSLDTISAYDATLQIGYNTTFGNTALKIKSATWMDDNYNWGNTDFVDSVGNTLNLAVNKVADVLHTLAKSANYKVLVGTVTVNNTTPYVGTTIELTVTVTDGKLSIPNTYVQLTSTAGGIIRPQNGYTDANGNFKSVFTVPEVDTVTSVTLSADLSKTGYEPNTIYTTITIYPRPKIELKVETSIISLRSGENAQFSILTYSNYDPFLANVFIELSSSDGTVSPLHGYSNSNGIFIMNFTAPVTVTTKTVQIFINGSKQNYINNSYIYTLTIYPLGTPGLYITGNLSMDNVTSNNVFYLNIRVTSFNLQSSKFKDLYTPHSLNSQPVEGVNIIIVSSHERLNKSSVTDAQGYSNITFIAPVVDKIINFTLYVEASKEGYMKSAAYYVIKVHPIETGQLRGTVKSKDNKYLENALIYIDSESSARTRTDKNGYYELSNISTGYHIVKVTLHGYKESSQGIYIENNRVSYLNFTLEEKNILDLIPGFSGIEIGLTLIGVILFVIYLLLQSKVLHSRGTGSKVQGERKLK